MSQKKQLGAVLTSPPSAHKYKLATEAEKEKRISANMSYEKELIDQNKLDAVSFQLLHMRITFSHNLYIPVSYTHLTLPTT